jgi:hypothetical protein
MRKQMLRILISVAAIGILMVGAAMVTQFSAGTKTASAQTLTYSQLNKIQKRLLDGFVSSELDPQAPASAKTSTKLGNYFPTGDDGCTQNKGGNVKVNQNCLNISDLSLQGRGQANNETAIAQDPLNPNNIVATSNDYVRGDGSCFVDSSKDGGRSWNESAIPIGFTNGATFGGVAREYWQAGGDPSLAWDTKGNAYMNCMVFMRGPGTTNNPDLSSGIYLFRSTGNGGASWNFTGRPVAEVFTQNPAVLLDKPYMTVDNNVGSPFQDRIYVTFTSFAADGTGYIFEAYSNDYGESFSAPVLVSGTSPLCTNTYGLPTPNGTCNENQFSDPFVGSDGALYVAYDNYNNSLSSATDNHNQVLLVKSTDGGATFGAPVLVGNFYDLPDCATYQGGQDAGRACVPEKGNRMNSVFRATNYPSGVVNPTNPSNVVVTFGSYINKNSNENNGCAPAGFSVFGTNLYTGVKTAGACNNKILVSVSNDGGTSFTGTTKDPRKLTIVNQASGQATTDQWWQWAAMTSNGKLAVSYYDRQYGNSEFNGNMDFSLSGSNGSFRNFNTVRVTSSSMQIPTQFPDAQGNSVFFGDYTGLSVAGNTAHPLWMDTRNPDLFLCPGTGAPGVPPTLCIIKRIDGITLNDQDIFSQAVTVPSA